MLIKYRGIEIELEQLPNGKYKKPDIAQFTRSGRGCTWLGDGRIPYESEDNIKAKNPHTHRGHSREYTEIYGEYEPSDYKLPSGRFPANLLVSDDVLNDGTQHTSGEMKEGQKRNSNPMFGTKKDVIHQTIGDSGSFSRYFDLDKWWEERVNQLPESARKTFPFLIVPKAAKSEKDAGLDMVTVVKTGLPLRDGSGDYVENEGGDGSMSTRRTRVKNIHPTVKPVALMSYLITLGSREGDVVVDPFSGSGTTPVAGKIMNRKVVAIDDKKEHCEIAVGRCRQTMMDVEVGEVVPEPVQEDGVPRWMKL